MKKLVLALCLLGAVICASVAVITLTGEKEEAPGEVALPPPPVAEEPEPEPEPEVLVAVAAEPPPVEEVAAPPPEPAVETRAPVEAEPVEERMVGHWAERGKKRVAGRVELPAGAPDDPTLFAFALSKDLSPKHTFGRWGVLDDLQRLDSGRTDELPRANSDKLAVTIEVPPEEAFEEPGADAEAPGEEEEEEEPSPEPLAGDLLAVAPVAADGSFELTFPGDLACGFVGLSGRYLFTDKAVKVDLAADAPTAVLQPTVGAWVTGTVRIPDDMDRPEVWRGIHVELEYDPRQFSWFDIGGEWVFDRIAFVDEEGRFEFRAVDTSPPYRMEIETDDLANSMVGNLALDGGRERQVEVELVVGGTIRGEVVGEDGAPVAEARVRAGTQTFMGFTSDRAATAETDENGRFELAHVPPGEVRLSAHKKGFLDSTTATIELADRQEKDGVSLELPAGSSVAGVVRYADGRPAAGEEVDLGFDPAALASMQAFNAARGADGRDETDDEGRFEITGLGKGPFQVTVEVHGEGDRGWSVRRSGVKPDTLDLELVLQPDPVLRGLVLDPAGQPLPRYHVQVEADSLAFWAGGDSREQDVDDAEGSFEVFGLYEGKWKLRISAEGLADSEWVPVKLPDDAEAPLEIVMAYEATAAGVVLDPDGTPIAGATVTRELDMMEAIAAQSGKIEVDEARTNEEGAFVLGGLSEGTISLIAKHADFVESAPLAVEVDKGGEVTGLELRLRRGGILLGEVFNAEGEPAAGATIFLQSTPSFMPSFGTTEPDGTFRRENVKPGKWQITSMGEDFNVDEMMGGEEPNMGEFLKNMRTTFVEVEEGKETTFVLGAPPSDPVKLVGTVTHAGEPADVMVVVFPEGAEGFSALKFISTDKEGRYEAELDKPGNYLMQVQVIGDSAMEQDTIEFPATIPEVEEHRIDVELPVGRITGRVIGVDGDPVANARITLGTDGGVAYGTFMGGRYVESTTDENGEFDLNYLRPGVYSISAGGTLAGGFFGGSANEGRTVKAGIEVGEGEWIRNVDFRLKRPGDLEGQVVDITGTPVPEAAIFVRNEAGSLLERFSMITTDGAGKFQYTGLAPGKYTVSARTADLASLESDLVEVRENQKTTTTITLDAGTILRIAVVDKTGANVRARISVRDPNGNEVTGMLAFQEIVEASGNLYNTNEQKVGPLPPGRYVVTAYADDGRTVSKPVNLSGQAERKLKVRLR